MNPQLVELLSTWHLKSDESPDPQVAALLEQAQSLGLFRATTSAVLLGEQYHLGGVEDTRQLAEALKITAEDHVIDLACYIGGPARYLAREYGCRVTGVDMMEEYLAVGQRLTQLCGLAERVQFLCCDANAVPLPDASFTVAWSQGSFPSDLSWLSEMHRLLVPGGRLGFTGVIRRNAAGDPDRLSLEEAAARVAGWGFRVLQCEDLTESDLELGWYPAKRKLQESEEHYTALMGATWVRRAYADLASDTELWRSGREGNGRIVAVKE